MSEMSLMADRLIVVGRGRLIADTTVEDFVAQASGDARARAHARARTAPRDRSARDGRHGRPSDEDGDGPRSRSRACRARRSARSPPRTASSCTSSTPEQASLEEAFMRLTRDSVEYHAGTPTQAQTVGAAR